MTALTADRLILAAGTLGSTFLLQKNRSYFPGLSPTLGNRFCGNGDLLTFGIRCIEQSGDKRRAWVLDGTKGPVITIAIRMPDAADPGGVGRGFYIEDAGYPAFASWLLEASGAFGTLRRLKNVAWRRLRSALGLGGNTNISAEISYLLGTAELSSTSLPLLGMGRDVADGRLELKEGMLQSNWRSHGSSEYFSRLRRTMRSIADAWDAGSVTTPSGA